MKTFQYLTISCLCLFLSTQAFAQTTENIKPVEKSQTTIIIKTIDKDGNENTQTITTEDGILNLKDADINIESDKIDLKNIDVFIKEAREDNKVIWEEKKCNSFNFKPAYFWNHSSQENCDKAFLGIMMTKEIHNENGVETITGESAEGVLISDVIKGTGAEDAGLLAEDILVAIDGKPMKTMDAVIQEIQSHEANDQVMVSYLRNGQQAQTLATLKAKKCDESKNVDIEIFEGPHELEVIVETENIDEAEKNAEIELLIDKIISIKKEKDAEKNATTPAEKETPINTAPQKKQTLDLADIDVFPNPSNGWVNINFRGTATATSISIVDVAGKEIYREELPSFDGNYQKEIDIRGAAKGTLFLNILQGEKVHTEKIILTKLP